jgi:hypothetical protein
MPSVTPGYTFTGASDPITYTKLNLLGQPTVAAVSTNDVTTSTIADLAVTTAKLADDAVTTAKIADDAVTTDQIASGNIYNAVELSGGTTITQSTPLYETYTIINPVTSPLSLTFSATDGNSRRIACTGSGAITINAATIPRAGFMLQLLFTTDGTGGNVITFGTYFKTLTATPTLTLTGTNKYFQIAFVSDGSNLLEMSRTAAVG